MKTKQLVNMPISQYAYGYTQKNLNRNSSKNYRIAKLSNCLILLLANLLIAEFAFSQAPNLMNYQAVALSTSGSPIANQTISIRATIRNSIPTGTAQYTETRTVTTDATGLFSFQLGSLGATSVSGNLFTVTWSGFNKYLQIEMDPLGGTNFTNMGTQQLVTVPYAFNAREASGLASNAIVSLLNLSSVGATPNSIMQYNGSVWAPASINNFLLPLNDTDANLSSFKITNTNTSGTAVHGKANGTTGVGVQGNSDGANGIGVYGESINGTAVKGYANNTGSIAVFGSSLTGTGIKAYSTSGLALDVDGKVNISGGNTNPSAGAVLTSDAVGNAVWKSNRVAFKANVGVGTMTTNGVYIPVPFINEQYDMQGNFNINTASTDANTFIAPVSGLYHFSLQTTPHFNALAAGKAQGEVSLYINGSFFESTINNVYGIPVGPAYILLQFDSDVYLNAGDKITCKVIASVSQSYSNLAISDGYFTGHLVFAD